MEKVEFTQEGLFYHRWNRKQKKFIKKKVKKLNVLKHLRDICTIENGVILKQIMNTVDSYKLLKLVISQYSWCSSIEDFHKQVNEENQFDPNDDQDEIIEYLEVYRQADAKELVEKIKHPGGLRERIRTISYEANYDFHGKGICTSKKEGMDYATGSDGKVRYGVSYTPLWKLANLPVIIREEFDVYESFDSKRHNKNNLPEKLLTTKKEFSLLEFLDAIYWDISFMGGPQDNEQFLQSMKTQVEEIEKGNVPLIPFEQVSKRLGFEVKETEEKDEPKILMHPSVASFFGVDPNSIPLDDKEIIRPEESE